MLKPVEHFVIVKMVTTPQVLTQKINFTIIVFWKINDNENASKDQLFVLSVIKKTVYYTLAKTLIVIGRVTHIYKVLWWNV